MHQVVEELMQKKSFWIAVRVLGLVLSPVLAAAMTFVLFYFMQSLIATGDRFEQQITVVKIVDATMPEVDLVVIEEIDKPEPIESAADDQPEVVEKRINVDAGPSLNIEREIIAVDSGLDFSTASISITDGDYLPLVQIAAQYPARAISRDIEGWCLVSFTVDGQGNVVEDSIVVLDSEPPEIFDRNSVRAALRLKFQPRVTDGVGVEVAGVQYLFRFELGN